MVLPDPIIKHANCTWTIYLGNADRNAIRKTHILLRDSIAVYIA